MKAKDEAGDRVVPDRGPGSLPQADPVLVGERHQQADRSRGQGQDGALQRPAAGEAARVPRRELRRSGCAAQADAREIESAQPRPLEEARADLLETYKEKGVLMYARVLEDLRTELRLSASRDAGDHLRLRALAARLQGGAR